VERRTDPEQTGGIEVTRKYSDCRFCGGEVREQEITREVWWKGKLHLIDGVPVGVCQQCGEKVILPPVARKIDRIIAEDRPPDHLVQVPSYRFRKKEPVS
jgi:YgiT-type zinc finger domain-containing protein